jgi:hypothetical protein
MRILFYGVFYPATKKRKYTMKKIYFLFYMMAYTSFSVSQDITTSADPNYFPIAVWLQSTSNASAYKSAGINMYIGLWNALDQPQLTALANAGMRVICAQNSFGLSKLNDTLIYGWAQDDEPDNAQWNETTQKYDPCIDPSVIINKYNTIKANDPSRPVYLNLGQGVSYINWVGRGTCTGKSDMYKVSNNGYLKGCDIGSFDIYPVNNSDALIKDNLWYVPKGIDSLKLWSGNTKPIFVWIETTRIDNNSPRKPTPAEVKSEVWMALIHGAGGFGYFCHSWTPTFDEPALLHDATMLAAVKNINTQITSLATVLNSPSTSGYATVSSSNGTVPIDIMTKNYGGANYIFAVGMRAGKTKATYTVASGTTVEVLGENRKLTVSAGMFTDSISTNYGVHLYKITNLTGITEVDKTSAVHVYPNPLTQSSTLVLPESINCPFSFTLFDQQGKIIYENPEFSERKLTLSREKLSSGMYYYSIKDKQQGVVLSNKLVIEE